MIKIVILWTNGLVMVFDDKGEQMAEYQGEYGRVVENITTRYSGYWHLCDWERGKLATFKPDEVLGDIPT